MVTESTDPTAGFREAEHTADWELAVWAPDFAGLLEQAARGMYTLAGIRLSDGPRNTVRFIVEGADRETLLVSFLEELRYLVEIEWLAFDRFALEYHAPDQVVVKVEGAPLTGIEKEIKAVTFHNLAIHTTARGLETNLVFDV